MAQARGTKKSPHVALLRGINVGGKNKLPMRDLVEIFNDVGCGDVRTYIQSGNVVFTASPALVARIPRLIEDEIAARLDLAVPVVVRSLGELRRVLANNPFLDEGVDPVSLAVAFLAQRPSRAKVASLDPARSPPDRFVVAGSEIHLHLPGGAARSKLTNAYFDAALGTTSTVRNLRTVTKLVELAQA